MRLNPGDVIKSVHTGNAFVVEYVSVDGHCFILQPRDKENSRSYNMHDFNRSFVRVFESDTLQAGNSPVTPGSWISCSERMPEQGAYISAVSKHGEYVAGQVIDDWLDLHDGTSFGLDEVYLWMMLPPLLASPQQ